jgi:hypothetical protein
MKAMDNCLKLKLSGIGSSNLVVHRVFFLEVERSLFTVQILMEQQEEDNFMFGSKFSFLHQQNSTMHANIGV